MTRYIVIDRWSGYVWGVVNAPDPLYACRAVDVESGTFGRVYTSMTEGAASGSLDGYDVVEAPTPDWDCDDGQDPDVLEYVGTLDIVAHVKFEHEERDDRLDRIEKAILPRLHHRLLPVSRDIASAMLEAAEDQGRIEPDGAINFELPASYTASGHSEHMTV